MPAPIAERANAACIVSWIVDETRAAFDRDVKSERFINDTEANSMLSRPERAPYARQIGQSMKMKLLLSLTLMALGIANTNLYMAVEPLLAGSN